jgi:phosphatidylserine/phosphatidylglycerophosphate/cardiolipin synthase-like enzyme
VPALSRPSPALLTRCARTVAVVLLPLLAVAVLSASAPAETGFNPVAGPQFNDPTADSAGQYSITNALTDNVAHAPKGSVIRMAFYSLSISGIVDALVKAHDRGVNVQVLMDAHGANSLWTKLVGALGTDAAAGSFAVLCQNGCVQGYSSGSLHAKFYMFSTTGNGHWVTTVSSANPTGAQATQAWNNAYSTVGDTTVYRTHYDFFKAMAKSATTGPRLGSYGREVLATPYRTYTFPRQSTGTSTDTMWQILNRVSCSGAAAGYGTAGHHTRIRVDMFEWTANRLAVAQKLAALRTAGCSIGVIYTSGAVDDTVKSTLTGAGISVADSSKDGNGDGVADHYTHDKMLMVDGKYNGNAKVRRVFTGSPNLTANSLKHNDESMVEIASSAVYTAYYTHWHDLWTWSKTASGTPTPQVKSAGGEVHLTKAQREDS